MGVTALFDKESNMTGISDHRITIDLVTSPSVHPPHLCPGSAPSKASLLSVLTSEVRGAGSALPQSARYCVGRVVCFREQHGNESHSH